MNRRAFLKLSATYVLGALALRFPGSSPAFAFDKLAASETVSFKGGISEPASSNGFVWRAIG
jgi:hypothetical protein